MLDTLRSEPAQGVGSPGFCLSGENGKRIAEAPDQMEIVSTSDRSELPAFKDDWARLSEQEPRFVPDFAKLQHHLQGGAKFRLLAARENSRIIAIACFIHVDTIKRYEIASRKLFDLPVKELSLFGSCVVGQADEDTIRKFFRIVIEEEDFDLINFGEIFVDSPLRRSLNGARGLMAWRVARRQELRWLARLPGSFDDYISSLRPTVKTRVLRDVRRFERKAPEYRVMRRPEDIETFLRDGEEVSQRTYQWNFGYRIRNDERLQKYLSRLAQNGNFRGYIAYLDGRPCAFGWGELTGHTFIFRATGYDPQHRNLSPGTAVIMHMIRDLIENADCGLFDFGSGREDGYKSRLGTVSYSCTRMSAARTYQPYPLLLAGLDLAINMTKNSLMSLVETIATHRALKRRLKSVLRPFGIGSY